MELFDILHHVFFLVPAAIVRAHIVEAAANSVTASSLRGLGESRQDPCPFKTVT